MVRTYSDDAHYRYSFADSPMGATSYIVPHPVDLSTNTPARWITDVIALNPTCFWGTPNVTTSLSFPPRNITVSAVINLAEPGLDVTVHSPLGASVIYLSRF